MQKAMFCWTRVVAVEMDAYNVSWPGLGKRYHRVVGCGEEEPRMAAACTSV